MLLDLATGDATGECWVVRAGATPQLHEFAPPPGMEGGAGTGALGAALRGNPTTA